MYQVGGDGVPSLEEPGYFPQQVTAPKATPPVVVAGPAPGVAVAPVMPVDSVAADSTGAPFASDSAVVTKTPKGKVTKKPYVAPQTPDNSVNYGLYGTLGAGALYGAYQLGKFMNAPQGGRGPLMNPNPQAIIPQYKQPLQIASREMKAKEIVQRIRSRSGAYTAEELGQLKKMGVTQDFIHKLMAEGVNVPAHKIADLEAGLAREAAAAAREGEGLWGAAKSGYSALRAMPFFKFLRKEDGGMYMQEGGDPDSFGENLVEFLDPTGVTSYDDVYRTFQDPNAAWWEKGLSVASAAPIVGKFGKAAKAFSELSKLGKFTRVAGKVMTPVAQMDRYVNPVSKMVSKATAKQLQNAPGLVKGLANFGTVSNQANRFFTGADMVFGYPGQEYGGEMDQMAYGGQMGWGLDLNSRRVYTDMPEGDQVGRTLAPVDPEDATYEAEKNEVIVGDMDRDGQKEMMVFGGKRHSQGGTPANQEGFIFSDTKNMRMKGPIVEEFGKTAGKKQYTPAQLAKQYDLNKYKSVLDKNEGDELQQRTAALMVDNYQKKLGKLALVQEAMKGFPQGIPQMAAETHPELVEKMQQGQEAPEQARYGGQYRYGGFPKMQDAGTTPQKPLPAWYKFFTKANTPKGAVSRTGKKTTYEPNTGNMYDDLEYWQQQAGREFTDAKDMQRYVFGELVKDKDAVQKVQALLGNDGYGYPAAHRFDDGILGARSANLFGMRIKKKEEPKPETPVVAKVEEKKAQPKLSLDDYDMVEGEDPVFSAPSGKRLPYNRFDVANLLAAAATPVKSYAPRMFLPDVQEMQGYYDQPDYNPLLAAANQRMQMNNTYGNASAAMAANTYSPELMQGIIQETQRARGNNLQTANSIAQMNNQLRNQANAMNAQLMQDNYDKWVKTQEETDIANKLKWRKDVAPAAFNMVNNRVNMEKYNALYPQYEVTGNDWRVNFSGGKNYGDKASSNGANYGLKEFFAENPELKRIYETGDDSKKLEIAKMVAARAREMRSMYSRNPKYLSGNLNNPYMSMMLGMPQVGPSGAAGYDYDE